VATLFISFYDDFLVMSIAPAARDVNNFLAEINRKQICEGPARKKAHLPGAVCATGVAGLSSTGNASQAVPPGLVRVTHAMRSL